MFDIRYKLRNNIKGQVLVDFVVKFTPKPGVPIGIFQVMVKKWQVYVDDASNIRGSGIGVVMISPEWLRLEKSLRFGFYASNNKVEYRALLPVSGRFKSLVSRKLRYSRTQNWW